MKNNVVISLVFGFIIVLAGCQSSGEKSLQATNDALVSELTAQAVTNIEATSEAMMVELTRLAEIAIPTSVPTTDYLTTTEDTSSSFALESWRILWFPSATFLADDVVTSEDWDDFVAGMARNLAIPEPYYWEYLQLPDDTRYKDIEEYYIEKATEEFDYKLAQTQQYVTKGGDDTYILSFTKGKGDAASRVVIQFWSKTKDFPASMLVFYVNPY